MIDIMDIWECIWEYMIDVRISKWYLSLTMSQVSHDQSTDEDPKGRGDRDPSVRPAGVRHDQLGQRLLRADGERVQGHRLTCPLRRRSIIGAQM